MRICVHTNVSLCVLVLVLIFAINVFLFLCCCCFFSPFARATKKKLFQRVLCRVQNILTGHRLMFHFVLFLFSSDFICFSLPFTVFIQQFYFRFIFVLFLISLNLTKKSALQMRIKCIDIDIVHSHKHMKNKQQNWI